MSALISLQATGAATRGLAAPKLRLSVRSEPLKEIERINTRERLSEEARARRIAPTVVQAGGSGGGSLQ